MNGPAEWRPRWTGTAVTPGQDGERRARMALSFLANPGEPIQGAALRAMPAADVLAAVTGTDADGWAASGEPANRTSPMQGSFQMAGQARRSA